MKVIIAGSRTIDDHALVALAIAKSQFHITEVVSGHGTMGVDVLAEIFAHKMCIPLKLFPAEWITYGMKAGPIRNHGMAQYADALIAIWDGKSKGTGNMIACARRRGLKIHIERTDQ